MLPAERDLRVRTEASPADDHAGAAGERAAHRIDAVDAHRLGVGKRGGGGQRAALDLDVDGPGGVGRGGGGDRGVIGDGEAGGGQAAEAHALGPGEALPAQGDGVAALDAASRRGELGEEQIGDVLVGARQGLSLGADASGHVDDPGGGRGRGLDEGVAGALREDAGGGGAEGDLEIGRGQAAPDQLDSGAAAADGPGARRQARQLEAGACAIIEQARGDGGAPIIERDGHIDQAGGGGRRGQHHGLGAVRGHRLERGRAASEGDLGAGLEALPTQGDGLPAREQAGGRARGAQLERGDVSDRLGGDVGAVGTRRAHVRRAGGAGRGDDLERGRIQQRVTQRGGAADADPRLRPEALAAHPEQRAPGSGDARRGDSRHAQRRGVREARGEALALVAGPDLDVDGAGAQAGRGGADEGAVDELDGGRLRAKEDGGLGGEALALDHEGGAALDGPPGGDERVDDERAGVGLLIGGRAHVHVEALRHVDRVGRGHILGAEGRAHLLGSNPLRGGAHVGPVIAQVCPGSGPLIGARGHVRGGAGSARGVGVLAAVPAPEREEEAERARQRGAARHQVHGSGPRRGG